MIGVTTMRILTALLFAIWTITVCSQIQTPQSPTVAQEPTASERAAREELNNAAEAYKAGHFAEAQQHSERALSLDPSNKTAHFFLARIIHQQYKPGDSSAENLEKARAAITAYQAILGLDQLNDEAYKAIAVLYASIHDDKSLREWVFQRASNPSFSSEKRAEAYALLAGRDWDCAFKITELPAIKLVEFRHNTPVVVYRKPKNNLDFERAKQCVSRGLEMAEMAIGLDSESEAAWSYKTTLLLEDSKLAEMDGQKAAKAVYMKAAKEAEAQATRLAEKRRRESATRPSQTPL